MFGTQISQKFGAGRRVRICSAIDSLGKPKYPAWEQHVGLEGIISNFYHTRYGPLLVDGRVGFDDVNFYNLVCDGDFTISVPEDMLKPA
jgi:hypothetical protein